MSWFLDTNICIYALKGKFPPIARNLSRHVPEDIKIPSLVYAELMLGAHKSQQREKTREIVRAFLAPFEVVPFCEKAAEIYAEVRGDLEQAGKVVGPNDLVIAATVLAQNGRLVTHDTREFSRVPHLKLESWTE